MWCSASLLLVAAGLATHVAAPEKALTQEQMAELLKRIDSRMSFPVDYRANVYMEETRQGRAPRAWQLTVFRRDKDDSMILLFTKPKTEAGKGTLRLDRNLFHYDTTTGKWQRQTERDRIAGTAARRRDFDDWDLSVTFDPTYVGQERLGPFLAYKLELRAKPGADVAFPILLLWVDTQSGSPLKLESRSASGRVAKTAYYPRWVPIKPPGSSRVVYYPKETRIRDDAAGGTQTLIVVQSTDLRPLPANIFTKAWIETQSR